jgi:hypothetical protein
VFREQGHISRPCVRDELAVAQEVCIPGGGDRTRLPGFEGGVSLLESLVVTLPVGDESRFHVEHTPVQKPSAVTGAFFYQAMDLRIDYLHRQRNRQIRQRCGPRAADLGANTGG